MFEQIAKVGLMTLTAVGIFVPAMLGGLMMVTAVVFCDVGPLSRCAHMGLLILSWCCGFAVIPVPALVALISEGKYLSWYLWPFPFAAAGLAYFVYLQKMPYHAFVASAYAALALLGFLYLFASCRSVSREQARSF